MCVLRRGTPEAPRLPALLSPSHRWAPDELVARAPGACGWPLPDRHFLFQSRTGIRPFRSSGCSPSRESRSRSRYTERTEPPSPRSGTLRRSRRRRCRHSSSTSPFQGNQNISSSSTSLLLLSWTDRTAAWNRHSHDLTSRRDSTRLPSFACVGMLTSDEGKDLRMESAGATIGVAARGRGAHCDTSSAS